VSKLAAMATQGKVYGLDFSPDSLVIARKQNKRLIDIGRVELCEGSVSDLPFAADTFDVVTAVETHFWWPDLPNGLRQIHKVVKAGGHFLIVAEVYKGAITKVAKLAGMYAARTGMHFLDLDEHRQLLEQAGFCEVQIIERRDKGWLCCIGTKPRA
jgi:ubiquinone/menaquinone biosynthesis C-methylase UbiE